MDQTEDTTASAYRPKSTGYYYLGSLLATLALVLFLSLLILTSFMESPNGLIAVGCIYAVVVLIAPVIVTRAFKRNNKLATLDYINSTVLRTATFFIMMTYANAKLLNGQLNVFYYALDTKLNDLDDIFMVWAFYGKSSFVQVMLGLMELIPAILLLFRRTTFIGALLMLPVNANIFMINSLYRVSPFTLAESGLLLAFNLYLIYTYKNEIIDTIKKVNALPSLFTRRPLARKVITGGKVAVLCLIGLLLIKTVYTAKSGQRKKTHPVTGGYELVNLMKDDGPVDLNDKKTDHFKKIYFERSWVSGFAVDQNNSTHNVRIAFRDRDSLKITVNAGSWDNFIPDNSSVFKGTYRQPNDSTLILKGRQGYYTIEAKYRKLALRNYDYWW